MEDRDDPVLRDILDRAVEVPIERRAAFLDSVCGGDARLRAEVDSLLAALEEAGDFLASPSVGSDAPEALADVANRPLDISAALQGSDAPGGARPTNELTTDAASLLESPSGQRRHVGPFKLLQVIGEGGMGVVYLAQQDRPVRRMVALKIIKPGMDSRAVIARFEAERQALAMMDHPNIARVFDAGTTESGRPYFVMELVRGVPITQYCDEHHLAPRERLALFVQVCQAVQHAHTKGIIHRDIKPSNVLVTLNDGQPAPKVIDFGIAKATAGQRLTDRTLFTEFQQAIGTPLYMSPEQAEMSALMDVDTRSDVYSLGVLLYELLTGTTPFDRQRLAKAAFDEIRRILREEEPPKPSTRLSTLGETLSAVSASRATEPKRLGQLMRGELDWIVMRALEKDRTRRYETANGLGRDVQRYLADEPVEASPASTTYKLRKLARRYRGPLRAAAVIAVVLVAATVVSTWQALRATSANRANLIATDIAKKQTTEALRQTHAAEVQSAQRLVAEGDALRELQRWGDAQARYREAYALFVRLEEPTLQADLGWWSTIGNVPLLNSFSARDAEVTCAATLPDSRTAVTGGADGVVRLWDLITGRELWTMRGHAGPVRCVAVSADGHTALSGGDDKLVHVWDLTTGTESRAFRKHTGAVRAVLFVGEGGLAASGGEDGLLRVWEVGTGQEIQALHGGRIEKNTSDPTDTLGPPQPILSLCASKDGRTIVTGSFDAGIRVWNADGWRPEAAFKDANWVPVRCIALSDDGKTILAGDGSQFTAWSRDGRQHFPNGVFFGHRSAVSSVEFFPGDRLALSASADRTIRRWDVAYSQRGEIVGDQSGKLSAARITKDGRAVLAVGENMRLWKLNSSSQIRILRGDNYPRADNYPIVGLAFSPDGRLLASSGDRRVKVWDVATGKTLNVLYGHGEPVRAVAFSPDGTRLVSGSDDGTLKLWDVAGKDAIGTLSGHSGKVRAVAFLDAARLVSASEDGTIRLWGAEDGRQVASEGGQEAPLLCMATMPGGKEVVAGDANGDLLLWSPGGPQPARRLHARPGKQVLSVASSPDGRVLAGYSDGFAEFWDTAGGGRSFGPFRAHDDRVSAVAFWPDGRAAVTANPDNNDLVVWDPATRRELHRFGSAGPYGVAIAPDGSVLASAGPLGVQLQLLSYPALDRAFEPAVAAARAKLQEQPLDAESLDRLGEWYAHAGADDWAVELLERARSNRRAVSSLTLARCKWKLDDLTGALVEFKRAQAAQEAPDRYLQLCMDAVQSGRLTAEQIRRYARAGRFEEAAHLVAQVAQPDQLTAFDFFLAGCIVAYLGDSAAYQKHCTQMLERFGRPEDDADTLEQTSKTCLLLPNGIGGDPRKMLEMVDRARPLAAQDVRPWVAETRMLALYRCGDFRAALGCAEEASAPPAAGYPARIAIAELLTAMSHFQLKQGDEALAALGRGEAFAEKYLPKAGANLGEGGVENWLIYHLLQREAHALIDGKGQPATATTGPATTRPAP